MGTEQSKILADMALKVSMELADKGKVIEGGWMAMKILMVPVQASEEQLEDMRKAFFLGAEHVWTTIFAVLDADENPTDKDMERMSKIHLELTKFKQELTK